MRWLFWIIFFVGTYPFLFIMYFILRNAGEIKGGYCFAVSVKREWMENDTVKEIKEEYRRTLKKGLWILAVIPLVTPFLPTFSVPFTIWMIWLLAVCIAPWFPLARANEKLKEWKRQNGLVPEGTHVVYAEMKNAGSVRRVKLLPFLPPMLLSAAAALWGVVYFGKKNLMGFGGMILLFGMITFLSYGVAIWMDGQRTQVISRDSSVNLNYARAKKNLWRNLWLWLAWLNTVYTVASAVIFAVDKLAVEWLLWSSVGYGVLTTGLILWLAKASSAIEMRYAREQEEIFTEDDDAWIGGVIYYNKNDKRTMVTQRIGVGTTANMATLTGKIWMGFGIAVLLIIVPGCCIWMMLEEFTPMRLSVVNDVLTAEQLKVDYEIPADEIENIVIIDEKPHWTKVSGTAMDNLCKGTFRIQGEKCQAFLNPQNDIFLQIETTGETYYMSAADDAGTQEIYETMIEALE